MTYRAEFNENRRCWRIIADYRAVGGEKVDICGAASERIAIETAICMNEARK